MHYYIQGQTSKSTNHFFHVLYHAMPHVTLLNSDKCASHPHNYVQMFHQYGKRTVSSSSHNVSDQHIILKDRDGKLGALIPEESNIDYALYYYT